MIKVKEVKEEVAKMEALCPLGGTQSLPEGSLCYTAGVLIRGTLGSVAPGAQDAKHCDDHSLLCI